MSLPPGLRSPRWLVVAWGVLVAAVMGAYYYVFYFPPRMVGQSDPDRFYHLGLSKLIASHGLLRSLPQAEDLGWAHYFPDKEFLFHVITGLASWMGGPVWVLLTVPVLGIAIVVCLYGQLARVLRPWQAAMLCLVVTLLTGVFVFRLTLLRPHLLAILCFVLLLCGFLRRRAWLVMVAAAGFALSYHAFYLVMIVVAVAWVSPLEPERRSRLPLWALAGLGAGILVNPYFPSNLAMSWMHLQIALGLDVPPDALRGNELRRLGAWEYLKTFGFLPFSVIATSVVLALRKLLPTPESAEIWFLFVLSAGLTAMSMLTVRGAEYAVPACMLLAGYAQPVAAWRGWLWLCVSALLLLQFEVDRKYYREVYYGPMVGRSEKLLRMIAAIPADARGSKVFNCEWDAGSYLLDQRPDLRFVDLLDPVFLWKASPQKYLVRTGLIEGRYHDPHRVLRDVFRADYVLCESTPLIAQMYADRKHFRRVLSNETATMWLFQLQGD
jgi:hypothetical protein